MNQNAKVDTSEWNESYLTQTEIACLGLCANGYSIFHIAQKMNTPPTEIEAMLAEAERKLKARNRLHAIGLAISSGLIHLA